MTPPALPLLLRTGHPVTRLQPQSRDFQVRVGKPGRHALKSGHPPECVLILTRTADQEMDELSLQLAASGIPMVRIDADRCTQAPTVWDPVAGTLAFEGTEYRPVVCWRRYFDSAAIRPVHRARGGERFAAQYTRDQWAAWGNTMASSAIRRINMDTAVSPPDRLTQLRAAAAAGLSIPATVVTSVPAQAARTIAGDGDLLVKSLGHHAVEAQPGALLGVFPVRVTRQDISAMLAAEPAPVIVQDYIEAPRELRVYIVGAQMFTYAVTRPHPSSLWTEPDVITVERAELPYGAELALWRIASALNLELAAFDLLDAPEGPVFLEVNTHCDWLWTERKSGSPAVSNAIRTMIEDLFVAHAGAPEGSASYA